MTIRRIAVIGAGTMGAGIAITAVAAGYPVVLVDRSTEALDKARARAQRHLARQAEKGRMTGEAAGAAMALLTTAGDLAAARQADLVIEAVFEKLEVKTTLLRDLEPLLAPDCLIATNTSCLRVSAIAGALAHPGRFLGLHYFSPVEANPLVELVRGEATDPGIETRVTEFLARTGRVTLPCHDRNGFVVNRFFCPWVNEAVRCHEDGLGTPAQIDAVSSALFGLPLGPFATTNMVGPAVMLHALENLAPLGDFYRPAVALRDLVARGALWDLAGDLSGPQGEDPSRRLRGALYLPLTDLLAEGVASPEDVAKGAAHALRMAGDPVRIMQADPAAPALIAALRGRHHGAA